jgi:hypothetical protein
MEEAEMASQHETVVASGRRPQSPADDRPPETPAQRQEPRTGAPVGRPAERPAAPPDRAAALDRGAAPTTGAARGPAPERTEEADLLLDVTQLTVDEITLEVQASVGLDHVKLDAKGLDASLFLKASLDNLVALRTHPASGRRSEPVARAGLRRMARALPSAERVRDDQPADTDRPDSASDDERPATRDDDDGIGAVLEDVRRRAATVAKQGGKAASVAVAGAAGGALLESKFGPRRRRGPRLPRMLSRRSGVQDLLSSAEDALVETVRRRLP